MSSFVIGSNIVVVVAVVVAVVVSFVIGDETPIAAAARTATLRIPNFFPPGNSRFQDLEPEKAFFGQKITL